MNGVLVGAAAGTLATVPMTIFWETMHERLPGEPPRPLPPREVAEALAVKAGISRQLTETQIEWLSMALHFIPMALCTSMAATVESTPPKPCVHVSLRSRRLRMWGAWFALIRLHDGK